MHVGLFAGHVLGTSFDNSWTHIRDVVPFGIVGGLSWSLWLVRTVLSRRYKPTPPGYRLPCSVVVPSYREDPEIFRQCLNTWLAEKPDEIIVVPDLADVAVIDYLRRRNNRRIRVIPFAHEGKRSALGVGIRAARHEIVVLTDSDTRWEPGLLAAVLAPFEDEAVGGVGTRQNAYLPASSAWRRVANWRIDIRYLDYVPAQSRSGAVICLSGRTAAYRRSVVGAALEHLENEFFLGRRCIAGDDGRLTWLVLGMGYKTVYQSTARALSMFPDTFSAFVRQRVRWSRNSYRCYLTAIWKGWVWRQPVISQLSVLQILLTPVTMAFALWYLDRSLTSGHHFLATVAVFWLLLGRAIRGSSHLRRHPGDIVVLPLVTVMTIFVAIVVKSYAFCTMNRQGWLTRNDSSVGADGQDAASLVTGGVHA